MRNCFKSILEDTPVIAAVKNDEGLRQALHSDIEVIFILYGDVCTIPEIVKKIKNANKIAMVHMDLVGGLAGKEVAVDYIRQQTEADGIITTKANLIKHAKSLGLYTVMRFFVMDSMALSNIESHAGLAQPDVIEVLPGVMPKIIKKVNGLSKVPVIAGGLIADKDDVMDALKAGAIAVSATSPKVWSL